MNIEIDMKLLIMIAAVVIVILGIFLGCLFSRIRESLTRFFIWLLGLAVLAGLGAVIYNFVTTGQLWQI